MDPIPQYTNTHMTRSPRPSYVSKSWVDANRNAVRDSHAIADTVTLGDGDTQQNINEEVDLLVDLGTDGVTHSKVVRFKVMASPYHRRLQI